MTHPKRARGLSATAILGSVSLAAILAAGCQTSSEKPKTKEPVAVQKTPEKKELSFIDFCRNPKQTGSEKLMKYLHPDPKESCEDARARLLKVSNINLKRLEIKDLRAISVFKNAKLMSLSYNPVTDLSPLRGFDNLQVLFLRHIALGDTVAKTEANCPTDEGMFKAIREFCAKK